MDDFIYKLKFFLEREIQSLQNELEYKTKLFDEIVVYCKHKCQHKWINDWIDINPDKSKHIIYCEKCELTKE